MTDAPAPLSDEVFESLRALQNFCYQNARSKGFHEAADDLHNEFTRASFGDNETLEKVLRDAKADRAGNRLMLIVGEANEAHDEIRKGYAPDFEWVSYPKSLVDEVGEERAAELFAEKGLLPKPEGVPSEIADIVIRCFDFSGEHGIDLSDVIRRKMAYNASRERLHGKQF